MHQLHGKRCFYTLYFDVGKILFVLSAKICPLDRSGKAEKPRFRQIEVEPFFSSQVNVDKSYAFAEFITPEDATAALAFDGVTLHGTTLKIRRPKDFAQPAVRKKEAGEKLISYFI